MESFLASFLMIFAAEMGDKTQLMAMSFTSRFKASQVFAAISAAVVLNNFIAVTAGNFLSGAFSFSAAKTVSGVLFMLFGFWTLRSGSGVTERDGKKVLINPFFTVAVFFFISEFGDKTQIAAMTLTMNYGAPLYVFLGASAGMLCANLIGIGAGVILGKKLSGGYVKWISALLFIAFGLAAFWSVLNGHFGFAKALRAELALAILAAAVIFIILKTNGKKETK